MTCNEKRAIFGYFIRKGFMEPGQALNYSPEIKRQRGANPREPKA